MQLNTGFFYADLTVFAQVTSARIQHSTKFLNGASGFRTKKGNKINFNLAIVL